MFADTDFLLALFKETDWLKEEAELILKKYEGEMTTSISVMLGVAIICKRLNINIENTFVHIFEVIKIEEYDKSICLKASLYIEENGLNVFDAFHAASCNGDTIISSNSAYDKIGIKRLNLRD